MKQQQNAVLLFIVHTVALHAITKSKKKKKTTGYQIKMESNKEICLC